MVDEDSHSTDLSVSGEEDHSTILLAHYIFGFNWGQSFVVSNDGYTKNDQRPYFCCTICIFKHETKKSFCFFEQLLQLLSHFRYKKQLLIDFGATFEQLFKKSFFA